MLLIVQLLVARSVMGNEEQLIGLWGSERYLMLNKGVWNGQKILPRDWLTKSFEAHASIYQADDYAYTWWRGKLPFGENTVQVLSATGNGGQLLVLVPELELAIGFTGGNYGDYRTRSAWIDKLIPKYAIEAVKI